MTARRPTVLQSTANPTVKRLVRMRDNRARRRSHCVIVDGWRETARAIQAGLQLCGVFVPEVLVPEEGLTGTEDDEQRLIVDAARQSDVLQLVTPGVMEKISYGQSPRGVVAEFAEPDRGLGQLSVSHKPLILVLDGIEKPGNVGAVFRCADAAGVDAVIITGDGGDVFNPNAIRSSLGAVFTVPSAVGSEEDVKLLLNRRNVRLLAARVESAQSLWATDLSTPLAIILGSEADGLGDRWRCDAEGRPIDGVRIPMAGQVDSLNISASAAVLAFAVARVRQPS